MPSARWRSSCLPCGSGMQAGIFLHTPAVGYLRSGIYVFLFAAWFYSICVRIVLVQVRRYLLAISALMVLWILLRSVKFSVDNMDAERWLWYFYYLPLLFIPPAVGLCFPVAGEGRDLSAAAMDKASVSSDAAAAPARSDKRSASAGVFLSVRRFNGSGLPI